MDQYVTGTMIRTLREKQHMTQAELAEKICVSDKAVSKWENGKGYPDISLLEPLAGALGVSVTELLAGNTVVNTNVSANMRRSKIYICPICGNTLFSIGEANVSCHGITLPPVLSEHSDTSHTPHIGLIEDELYITIDHPMTKGHYISFIAGVSDNGIQFTKQYPEGACQAYIRRSGTNYILLMCNKDGLFRYKLPTSGHRSRP